MEKKETSKVKSNVISGMSSTVGAAAGVVAGSFVSSEVNAAEVPVTSAEEPEVEVVNSQPAHSSSSHSHQNPTPAPEPEPTPEPTPEPEPEPRPEPEPEPEPDPEPEPEIEVISYDTVTTEDGGQMDVAVVSANGQAVMIADVNQDGVADVMASDLNNNGQLDEGEIIDVSGQNIAMQPLQEAANAGTDNLYAQTNDVDYINDANVDDYMA